MTFGSNRTYWLLLFIRNSGEMLQEYKGHICKVSPEQVMIALVTSILQKRNTVSVFLSVQFPQSFKMDCCLTNDDAFVIGGSEDGFVFFWELVDAPIVATFRAHSSVVLNPCQNCILCFFVLLLLVKHCFLL